MIHDTLDTRLAFLLQAHAQHIEADRLERMTRNVSDNSSIVTSAEREANAAARLLDTATDEFLAEIREYTKRVVMQAVAALDIHEPPAGVPHTLRMHRA